MVGAIPSTHSFFQKLSERLDHSKAVVRLNLLRLLRIICETSPERVQIVERYGFITTVRCLREKDPAVLVKEMAGDLLPILLVGTTLGGGPKSAVKSRGLARSTLRRKITRRSTSETSANEGGTRLSTVKSRQFQSRGADACRQD